MNTKQMWIKRCIALAKHKDNHSWMWRSKFNLRPIAWQAPQYPKETLEIRPMRIRRRTPRVNSEVIIEIQDHGTIDIGWKYMGKEV